MKIGMHMLLWTGRTRSTMCAFRKTTAEEVAPKVTATSVNAIDDGRAA